ncbi:MAG: DUF87 domain-containing protein [Bacilli bacterium]|nr:DUF87 domain-containing protein [Bacilli bacterium]
MFDRIVYISDQSANIKLKEDAEVTMNLMNLHLVFEDDTKKVLGEVDDLDGNIVKARFLGEIVGDRLIGGTIRKPSLDAKIRVIDKSEVPLITGTDTKGFMKLGVSPFYDDFPVFLDVNNFFSNHFAIFGNTGSGKSCGVSRLFQNMFHDQRLNPYKANILIFDSSGEYYNAFNNLSQINSNYNYRFYSTNEVEGIGEKLRLPIYLLNKDDLALLLQCTSHSQLPIIERMLKLALVFSQNDMDSNAYKNHLIAKAIMTILYTNETAPNKRNEIFSILASCSTDEFNLEAPIQGVGYTRKFRECFLIDNSGNFTESVLLTEYINSFIKEEYDNYEPHAGVYYDLQTLEKALNFTLISEGWLRNEQTYGDSVTIRVRLHALIVGDNAKYFDVKEYVSLESYLSSMLITDGRKYQVVNVNLNDIDDDFAKVLTKIYSRLIFDFAKGLKNRGSIPFHIVLEEAHRYIQSDTDRFLFGYNIFERIAKEGRKYGVILGLISQRPVEISDTVISQCTNFLIFKINHPVDVEYIRKMVPNITDEIVEKQKSLQAGTCLGFGLGFKIPLIVKMEMPNPSPLSSNCDVVNIWSGSDNSISVTNPVGPSTNTVAVSDVSVVPEKSVSSISIEIPKIESNPTEEAQTPVLMVNGDEAPVMTNSTGASNNLNSILNIGEEEKFDDSFVIDSNSAVSPAAVSTDSNVSSLNNPSISTPSISSSSDVSSFDSATAIPEITSVELSDNGMTAINDVPKITNEVSSEQPVLEITDDDDDDGVSDFGPDFS